MLGAPRLPAPLSARLRETTSYLFLGFQFDRWHTQMLLRLLDVKNAARRFALHSQLPQGADNEAFILKHYRIRFLGDDEQLIQNLYDRFREENLLRPAKPNGAMTDKQIIKKCIQNDDLDDAVRHLLKACAYGNLKDEAIMIQSNFASLKKEKPMISTSDYDMKRNRIVESMLQLIKRSLERPASCYFSKAPRVGSHDPRPG
ncbi:MAG: hypothetical protein H6557_26725 [Lewinellaceae bacterium]|nr:hypothetical protein [Phaeodactylibacter sp.]MCB9040235.1 hypothetical protein [Lewinellaceae bacterium]